MRTEQECWEYIESAIQRDITKSERSKALEQWLQSHYSGHPLSYDGSLQRDLRDDARRTEELNIVIDECIAPLQEVVLELEERLGAFIEDYSGGIYILEDKPVIISCLTIMSDTCNMLWGTLGRNPNRPYVDLFYGFTSILSPSYKGGMKKNVEAINSVTEKDLRAQCTPLFDQHMTGVVNDPIIVERVPISRLRPTTPTEVHDIFKERQRAERVEFVRAIAEYKFPSSAMLPNE